MSTIYHNWERLVGVVLRREEDWELCHAPSVSTRSSDFSSASSPPADFPLNFSASSSWHHSEVDPQVNFENSLQVLKPEEIYVNKKPISSRELAILQRCPNPPINLRSGSYWYDKHSGFWGKQGYKPSQIITANLNVGGYLDPNASYGNTSVRINGREITKSELWMLAFFGVKCPRETYFWMYGDGSYQEEGKMLMKRSIWSKASPGKKLICSLLSLPFPPKSSHASGDFAKLEEINKILLIGCSVIETITFFKQAIDIFNPNYQLITARKESFEDNNECLGMFEDVRFVILSISLTDYDQLAVDEHGTHVNKMMLNKKLFENVATHPSLNQTPVLLLLEQYNLFEEKIERSPLNQCDWFREFNPITDDAGKVIGNLGEIAIHYISVQFEILYASVTGQKLYVKKVNDLDQDSVDEALNCAGEILKWG